METYERAKQFYSHAAYALSDFLHGRMDERAFRKQWHRLADKAVNETKRNQENLSAGKQLEKVLKNCIVKDKKRPVEKKHG